MPRGNQLSRQWRLLQALSRPRGLTVEAAAREMGCTVRTIWRDLAVLQAAGFPIYDERDGRCSVWKVEPGFPSRLPVPLALDEIVALLVSGDILSASNGGPFAPAIGRLLGKIRGVLPEPALAVVDQMRSVVGAHALRPKLQLGAADFLPQIQAALASRRTIRVRYYSMSRDAETERRIDPYHLTYFQEGLYLVGHCHLRRAVRVFAIERMRAVEVLEETFSSPVDFDPEVYLRSAWGLIRGETVTVKVVFSKAVAPYIRERLWHPSQQIRELSGGRLELTLRVADTLEVRRWLLGFGGDAEVVAPAALREAIHDEASRVVTALGSKRKPPARIAALQRSPASSPRHHRSDTHA